MLGWTNAFFCIKVRLVEHELLLNEKEAELADLHRVWEIPFTSLTQVRRIDIKAPGAYGEVWEMNGGFGFHSVDSFCKLSVGGFPPFNCEPFNFFYLNIIYLYWLLTLQPGMVGNMGRAPSCPQDPSWIHERAWLCKHRWIWAWDSNHETAASQVGRK